MVAATDQGLIALLDANDLEKCGASPERLVATIEDAIEAHGIDWPAGDAART